MRSAIEEYYLDVLRCLIKSKGAKCPGEEICTTDPLKGEIAKRAGETLESYCNKERCLLFPTKSTPVSLISAINTIEDALDDSLIGLAPTGDETAWEIAAIKAATRARKTVEAEQYPKDPGSSKQDPADAAAGGRGDQSGIAW